MPITPNMPELAPAPKTGLYRLCKRNVTEVQVRGVKYRITIEPDYDTDGASVPRIAWGIWGSPWDADAIRGALNHDGLYQSEALPRDIADEILYAIWRQDGMSWLRAWTGYRAVRRAGWAVWARHTRQSIAKAKQFVSVEVLP